MHLLLPDRKVSLRRRLWLWIANRCDLLWPRWTSGRPKCFWPHRGWCPGKTCSPCLTSEALQSWSTRTIHIKVFIITYVSYLKWFKKCNRLVKSSIIILFSCEWKNLKWFYFISSKPFERFHRDGNTSRLLELDTSNCPASNPALKTKTNHIVVP